MCVGERHESVVSCGVGREEAVRLVLGGAAGSLKYQNIRVTVLCVAWIGSCWLCEIRSVSCAKRRVLTTYSIQHNTAATQFSTGLIHKCYEAKKTGGKFVVFGSGKPLRQFIYSDDLARCLH